MDEDAFRDIDEGFEEADDAPEPELETVGEEAGFSEALVAAGCECVPVGPGRLKMVVPVEFEMREIYRLAAERDLQLRRLNYRRDTLEDIFLKAMGN